MKTANKKYHDFIDFPVEIVGKDGVVRYYTFEESVSLYQRRIRLARLRYDTPSARQREIEHCSNRIAQLRRSFFARYGWESFETVGPVPVGLPIEISGEISAYFRRQFGCGTNQNSAILECIVEEAEFWMFTVQLDGWQGVLYCSSNLITINKLTKQFANQPQKDAEFIVDMYESGDFAVLLTSVGGVPEKSKEVEIVPIPSMNAIFQCISDGNLVKALALSIQIVDEEPFNKQAYWAGIVLSEQLRVHTQGLMLVKMALSHFPDEPLFLKRVVELHLRLGEYDRAVEQWETLDSVAQKSTEDILFAIILIQQNRYSKAYRHLMAVKPNTSKMKTSKVWIQKLLLMRTLMSRVLWGSIVLWFTFGAWVHIAFVGCIVISLALLLWMEVNFRKRLQTALIGSGYVQLSLIAQNDVYALNRNLNNVH